MSLIFFFGFLSLCGQDLVLISSSLNSIGHIKKKNKAKKPEPKTSMVGGGEKLAKTQWRQQPFLPASGLIQSGLSKETPVTTNCLFMPDSSCSPSLPHPSDFQQQPINLQATPWSPPPAPSCLQPPPFPSKKQLHPGRWWKKCGQISDLQHSGNGFIAIVWVQMYK